MPLPVAREELMTLRRLGDDYPQGLSGGTSTAFEANCTLTRPSGNQWLMTINGVQLDSRENDR